MNHNLYLDKIFKLNLLSKDGGFALDFGCGKGGDSRFLTENGYDVASVDKESNYPGVVISDIRDFIIEPDKYSFITCHNVLPFLASQDEVRSIIEKIVKGLKKGGLIHFTLFGKNSGIKTPVYFTYTEVEDYIGSLNIRVYEKSTREGPAISMKGEIVHVHIHTFLLRK